MTSSWRPPYASSGALMNFWQSSCSQCLFCRREKHMSNYGLQPDEERAVRGYITSLCAGTVPEQAPALSDERWTIALRLTALTYRDTSGNLRQVEQRMAAAVNHSPIMPLLLACYREIASLSSSRGAAPATAEEEQAYTYIRMLLRRSSINGEPPLPPRPRLEAPWDRRLQQLEVTFLATRGNQVRVRQALLDLRTTFEPLRRLFPEPVVSRSDHASWIVLEEPNDEPLVLVPDKMIFAFDRVEANPSLPAGLQEVMTAHAKVVQREEEQATTVQPAPAQRGTPSQQREEAHNTTPASRQPDQNRMPPLIEKVAKVPTAPLSSEAPQETQSEQADPTLDDDDDEDTSYYDEPDYDAMEEIENELAGWGALADDTVEEASDQGNQEGGQTSQAGSLVQTITHTGDYLEAEAEPLPEAVRFPAEFTRDACPTLDLYEEFSREASPEADDDFHAFCGLFLLSTIMARRVYLPMQRKRIYGNLMIALCARTSLFAKTTTVEVATEVLEEAGLGFLLGPDRSTPQKMLSDMSGNLVPADYRYLDADDQEFVRHELAFSGQRGFFFDELGKFLEELKSKTSTNAEFVSIMLTLDGCPRKYRVANMGRGKEPIKDPYMALIGCMTPPNISAIASAGATFWRDGFWARVSFIAAPTDSFKDAPFGIGELPIPPELISKLRAWHVRLGIPSCQIEALVDEKGKPNGDYRVINRTPLPQTACTMSQEAYEAWVRYRRTLRYLLARLPHNDFDGSYARMPTTAMRIAVIIGSLENGNSIELKHWAKAQELTEVIRANLHELYAQINAAAPSLAAQKENEIYARIKELAAKGKTPITAARLKSDYLKNHEVNDLQLILERLVKNGLLSKQNSARNTGKYDLAIEE